MTYNLNLTNGSTLIPGGLSDGTIDGPTGPTQHTSLTLVGRDYAGYGVFINENFISLLENFANSSSPSVPLKGQLWWDTTNNVLRVWSGSSWKISTGATSSPFNAPPSDLSSLGGDLWFDTTNQQLKVYTGSAWVTVGPVASTATPNTGALPQLMTDTLGGAHIVIQFVIAGIVYAILSKDTFSSSLAGFPRITAGLTFSTVASPLWGISTQDVNATPNTLAFRDASGGLNATAFNGTVVNAPTINATTVSSPTFTGNLVGNVTATTVAASTVSVQGVNASSGYTGTILTASQPNITTLGNIYNLSTNGTTNLTGLAYYNGAPIATIGGSATFTSINNTPIGNVTPSTGAFTTLTSASETTSALRVNGTVTATNVNAPTIGNTGATLTGTLSTATQNSVTTMTGLTSIGTIATGTWNGSVISPTYGGTGVNNGVNTLTLSSSYTLNQSVASGAAPTFTGTNFSGIPNAALSNNTVTITAGSGLTGGGTVALGGSTTLSLNIGNYVSTISAGTGVSVSASTGAVTVGIGQAVGPSNNVQFNSIGVGTGASGTAGTIYATNNIVAYYSDDRLKTRLGTIDNALDKVLSLTGFYYEANETAQSLGYQVKREVGLSAQDVERVQPEVVNPAPIDNQYLTVDYERLVPLLVEAIKELKGQVDEIRTLVEQKDK